jgi:DNA-binding transcriptional MocR family regulator
MYGQYIVPPPQEMVKFGVGQPSPKMLPIDLLRLGMEYTAKITDPALLQYGDISGYSEFRECLAKYLTKAYNCSLIDKDELFVTNGVTDALALVCSLLTETGSTVYVEDPTYFLAINIFKNDFKLNVVSVPIEEDGIDLDALERELRTGDSNKIRLLYTIPTFHNPTSYTMSHEKRVRLAKLADTYENFN